MFSLPKSRTSLTIHSIASIVTTSILVEEFRLFFVFNEKISELNVFTASCTMAFVHFELVGYLKKKNKITTISHGIVHNEINKYWSIVACWLTQFIGWHNCLSGCGNYFKRFHWIIHNIFGHFSRCYHMRWTFTVCIRVQIKMWINHSF